MTAAQAIDRGHAERCSWLGAAHRTSLGSALQKGVVTVEFGVLAALFVTLILGAAEVGHVLYQWNSAVEATRLGARLAAVCDIGAAGVQARVRQVFPRADRFDLIIDYQPAGCDPSTCRSLTVQIPSGQAIDVALPLLTFALDLPRASTTLPRESLRSTVYGVSNPACGGTS